MKISSPILNSPKIWEAKKLDQWALAPESNSRALALQEVAGLQRKFNVVAVIVDKFALCHVTHVNGDGGKHCKKKSSWHSSLW